MEIVFGTTSERKVKDLKNIANILGIDVNILGLDEIGWDRGEIEENGKTIEENSLIKAKAIYDFCKSKNYDYHIITDDAGLFCEALDGKPGVFTARYADDELEKDKSLPKYQCVIKLLRKLEKEHNRNAKYRCCVTCMMNDGSYFQEFGESNGTISKEIMGELKKPYFYSVFILNGYDKPFSSLNNEELKDTYRYQALQKTFKKINRG